MNLDDLGGLGLIDLVVLLVVVGALVGALRRGLGLFGALGSGAAALVGAWLLAVAVTAWAPAPLADDVRDSALVTAVPYPHTAVQQAQQFIRSPHSLHLDREDPR